MQALQTFALVAMARCLLFQTLLDSLEKVDEALPMNLLISVSSDSVSDVMEPRY
jgi:hypothetical protein